MGIARRLDALETALRPGVDWDTVAAEVAAAVEHHETRHGAEIRALGPNTGPITPDKLTQLADWMTQHDTTDCR